MDLLTQVFERSDATEQAWVDEMVVALRTLDPELDAQPKDHPFAGLLTQGATALPLLLQNLGNTDPVVRMQALDAIGHVLLQQDASSDTISALRNAFIAEENTEVRAVVAKCLALARDPIFLREQMKLLVDDDPAVVAMAARLLGYARWTGAVDILHNLVSPDRFFESESVMWALGEIGDARSIPVLTHAVDRCFAVEPALMALGKIGSLSALPVVRAVLEEPVAERWEPALRALAIILHKNRDVTEAQDVLRESFVPLLRARMQEVATLSPTMRVQLLLCLARLGEQLEQGQIRQILGLAMQASELDALTSYFIKR